ncbi:MAG: alpha/beta hydrolase [Elusimicrobiaceae bacterium]|nr:alpha/beta hydrolase [Elusimicrobiaceae bacterium]
MRKYQVCFLGLFLAVSGFGAPKSPSAQEVSLSTKDGWTLSALYLPAQNNQRTIILLHDLGKNKEAFTSLRQALAKAEMGYLALDLRGYGRSTSGGAASSFAREGVDNPFNKMTRDVDSAVEFLKKKGVPIEQMGIIGAGLGANVAAKSMTFWPQIPLVGLISPATNIRDVLAIPAMRLYKGNVLIAAGAADKKLFLEASVIRNVAYLTQGPDSGKVTFLTAYDKTSHEMLDQYLIPAVLQWLKTPQKPETIPDEPAQADTTVQTDGVRVEPSQTEESLFPSVLN